MKKNLKNKKVHSKSYRSMAPTDPIFIHLTISDVTPFIGRWGIFTLNSGQKITAFVDSVDTVNNSMKVLFSNGGTATIDVAQVSMAEGPFPTMPTQTIGTGTSSPTGSPTGTGNPTGTSCRWVMIPGIGWVCV
ncbi:hypothetical protein [Paenibacillus illinoisensis]|uniref:hypothetical protein n=1 Tax=Paenibacillus illinoisensis TaxID=59845 RepID=UPI001C8E81F5|nr:hypothetical protein [Paenibacillus illinoisensis]MBY0217928.1 hypothetical protein [Paenibacillus illinoisensis]